MRRDLSKWFGSLSSARRSLAGQRMAKRSRGAQVSLAGGEPLDGRKMLAVTANLTSGLLTITLDANDDVAGLVRDGANYKVYDNGAPLVTTFPVANVDKIKVEDDGTFTGQVFTIGGDTITAALGVESGIENTRIFGDIDVTSGQKFDATRGVLISSGAILMSDASPAGPLVIKTTGSDIEFGGRITIMDDSAVQVGTGSGAGDIDFNDDIEGSGEGGGGSGTLTLTAGTGAITFGGDIGGAGVGEDLHGVSIESAASVSATGQFHITDALGDDFTDGLIIGDGVNNVNFVNGGEITGFGEDGAGIWFQGASTGSTVKGFELTNNTYGIYLGGAAAGVADLSGTVIDDNDISGNDFGIYLEGVSGELGGEDALVIGGIAGNFIHANGEDGIYADSSVGVEISQNTIWTNGVDGYGAGSGIKLVNGGTYLIEDNTIGEDVVLRGVLFGGNTHDGITVEGIAGEDSYAGTVITGNTIQNNGFHGVSVTGVTLDSGEDSLLIFNNDIVSNGSFDGASIEGSFGGIRIDNSTGIRIINNDVSLNGTKGADGIAIVNGSAGTQVYSNTIASNSYDGIYLEDSSTFLNPTQIGDVLPVASATGTTVNIEGDLRAQILAGQTVVLAYVVDPTDITTATLVRADVLDISYDDVADETTLTFASVSVAPGAPFAVSLGNYIAGNGEDQPLGAGINVYASGFKAVPNTVAGLEILGNIVVGNAAEGIRLEGASSDGEDLTQITVAGNFVGHDPLAPYPVSVGNGKDGIYLKNGSYVLILQNYVADNGDPNPSVGDDENGIAIYASTNVDIGEDGLGNYVSNNADDGIDINGSRFISIVDNEIASNGDDGIYITSYEGTRSSDILVENNWIHDNAGDGIEVDGAVRVDIVDNLIENNGSDGVRASDGEDVYVGFSIVRGNEGDGVAFSETNGVIEGNEIYENGEDGIYIDGDRPPNPFRDYDHHFEVLGNIIRNNGDDGIDVRNGNFDGNDRDGVYALAARIAGNTIELNSDNGVALDSMRNLVVGGEFQSDINFINLNGNAGVYATGIAQAEVRGNEIDSNVNYGIEIDNGERLYVGGLTAEDANTIRRNGKAGVYAYGNTQDSSLINNEISENPIGVMITSALGLQVGGPTYLGELPPDFPGEDLEVGNHIFDNGEGIRATGDSQGTVIQGNLIEDNLTGATLASVRGLAFGYVAVAPVRVPAPYGNYGNTVQNNKEGLRASGDLTDTVVASNQFLDNTKVGIALSSAKNLTVGGYGEDSPNVISGSPIGLSASGTMTNTLVASNEFSENTIGISLSKATAMIVAFNVIDSSLKYGISVTGNNDGTEIGSNTVTNTGDGPYLGSGIYLNNARNVYIGGNEVDGSSLAGLYATGNTSGTVVQGNLFTDNRIGMFLENATNAVFGGLGKAEGNTIVGGGDPFQGEFRDGILATGTLTGSSITGTDISDTATGVWFQNAQGIDVNNTLVSGSEFFGFRADGNLTGSKFRDNLITNTVGIGGGLGHGMYLNNATNLEVYNNIGEDSFGSGLFVTGDTSGTTVKNNLFDGNRTGITLDNATNAVIGGLGEDEGNTIIGGGDSLSGQYCDGILATGTLTGSSITGTDISDTATGVWLRDAQGVDVNNTLVNGSEFFGFRADGVLTGSKFRDNDVVNTVGIGGGLGHGMYLNNATNLKLHDNLGEDSFGSGLYITGNTSGTTVRGNLFDDNRVGITLDNATNAVIGGDAPGEDNRIVGGGDAVLDIFRDGIVAIGISTGSSITKTTITNTATGITLRAATGLIVRSATVSGSQVWGLNASGTLTGTEVRTSTFTLTTDTAGGGAGVLLSAAQSLLIQSATITDNVVGLLATGDCAGSSVIDTTWSGNTTGVINNSTGVPPLDIDPLP